MSTLWIVDIEPMYNSAWGMAQPRFIQSIDIDVPGHDGQGGWRLRKPLNRLLGWPSGYWEGADGLIYFKPDRGHRNAVGCSMRLDSFQGHSAASFPTLGQYGEGRLFNHTNRDNSLSYSRVLWFIDQVEATPMELQNGWIGLAGKVGGHLALYRQEIAWGFIVNCANLTECWEIAISTQGVGPGLGASTGICLIAATGPNATSLVGQSSTAWDFSLAFTAKVDGYLKALRTVHTFRKLPGKVGELSLALAKKIPWGTVKKDTRLMQSKLGALPLKSSEFSDWAGRAKTVLSGLSVDWSAVGFTLIDIPAPTPGLEIGITYATAKVVDCIRWS